MLYFAGQKKMFLIIVKANSYYVLSTFHILLSLFNPHKNSTRQIL